MDERGISERLENRNVQDPRDPTFAIVGQEDEIVALKYVWLTLRNSIGRPVRLRLQKWHLIC
jgi:hypothetical protein